MRSQNWISLWDNGGHYSRPVVRQRVDRLLEDLWAVPSTATVPQDASRLIPACDVEETEDHYLLTLEMAGVKKDDIQIQVVDDQIQVTGERHDQHQEREGAARYTERRFGRFERKLALPAGVDAGRIEADYEDGLLRLRVPKTEATKPRQIRIGNRCRDEGNGKATAMRESEPAPRLA